MSIIYNAINPDVYENIICEIAKENGKEKQFNKERKTGIVLPYVYNYTCLYFSEIRSPIMRIDILNQAFEDPFFSHKISVAELCDVNFDDAPDMILLEIKTKEKQMNTRKKFLYKQKI